MFLSHLLFEGSLRRIWWLLLFQSRRVSRHRKVARKAVSWKKKGHSEIMSASESSLGSPGSSAAPPPPAPAAAPPAAPSAPTAAPTAPVAAPAVIAPDVPAVNDAVATATATPGAQPSQPAPPKTLDEAKAIFHQRLAAMQEEGAQPEATPGEAQPVPIPLETKPEAIEAPEPIAEPAEAAPVEEATAPAEAVDSDYKEHFLTAEEIEARYNRKLSKKERADIVQMEAHRAELAKDRTAIGGDLGVKLATTINAALLTDCPFDETTQSAQADAWYEEKVDAICDQFILPENAGAEKLFDRFGKRLVNLQLQEATCGSCHSDGNKANPKCGEHVPMGKEFAGNMISEEWGKNPDGSPFDFKGMNPLGLVDLLLRAAQLKDEDGDDVLNVEFLKAEVEGRGKPKPTARELELQRENEELRKNTQTTTEAEEAELNRQREETKAVYQTQSKNVVRQQIMAEVTPLFQQAGWVPREGEEGPQLEQKKRLGRMVATDVNTILAATPEYAAVQKMIDDKTAFDPATGRITPRFDLKLKPLRTMAKALSNETIRLLASQFKFAASSSRNAQLVKNNGNKVAAQPAAAAPPLAVPQLPTDRPLTAVEQLAVVKEKYRADKARAEAQAGVL